MDMIINQEKTKDKKGEGRGGGRDSAGLINPKKKKKEEKGGSYT